IPNYPALSLLATEAPQASQHRCGGRYHEPCRTQSCGDARRVRSAIHSPAAGGELRPTSTRRMNALLPGVAHRCVHIAPTFVARRAGRLSVVKPGTAFPKRKVGDADATAGQPDPHFAAARFNPFQFNRFEAAGSNKACRYHRVNARLSVPDASLPG